MRRLYIRGNRRKRGAPAPLQFLALLSPERKPFEQGSGRLELARAIVDRQNPLTARVIVNRVWHHHFGRGLVESTSDFGRRSDPPSHPELLDHLAVNFIRKGWSLKRLHRAIVLSQTYRQVSAGGSSAVGAGPAEIDPDNRWLWRMNRRRLSFEALRDSLLAASAELDRAVGGEPVDPWQSSRRTIYGYVNRYRIAAGYETFDFPSSQRTSPKRLQTLTPQQSLFLMNAPFVEERARRLVESLDFPSPGDSQDPLRAIYHRVLSRDPTPAESQAAQQFLSAFNQQSHAEEQANSRWRQLAHALFLCNEFMYVD